MEYLEVENERLKEELRTALEEIQSLREENLQLKSQLKEKVHGAVRRAGGRPILMSYSSDGAPLRTRERVVRNLTDKQEAQRSAGKGADCLIQQRT